MGTILDLVAELRTRRQTALERRATMLKRCEIAKRDLNTVEQREWDGLADEIRAIDDRIDELMDDEQREGVAAGAAKRLGAYGPSGVEVGRESGIYHRGAKHSFFADSWKSRQGDVGAQQRLIEHKTGVESSREFRDLTRIDGAGGEFVPPLWLMDQYAAVARAGRVTADLMRQFPLPPGTDSISIPKVDTGGAVAIQTADNAAVQETDMATTSVTAAVRTIAGQQDMAIQLLEQSPSGFDEIVFQDLLSDYAKKLDLQVLDGTGLNGQVKGLLQESGTTTITYTDATPTVGELYSKLADGINQMSTNRFLPPEAIVMHPRRWAWFLAALDTQNRPLVVPEQYGPHNASAVAGKFDAGQSVGSLLGLPVHVDANIPTNLGAGTNEDRIILVRGSDHFLWESSIRTRVLPDVLSANLTVRAQLYAYCAFTSARFAKSTVIVAGTGLSSPSF